MTLADMYKCFVFVHAVYMAASKIRKMPRVFNSQMRLWRLYRDMSQEDVAKGWTSHATIQRYETGKQIPPTDKLQIIANVLGVDTNTLLHIRPPPPQPPLKVIRKARKKLT